MERRLLHETYDVYRGTQRFRELIVYISMKCANDHWFGATKLNKILYHSDFRSFERFGVPLTGMRYVRLPKGPAPRALLPIRNELMREGALKIEKRQVGPEHFQERTIALRDPVVALFTGDELALVDEVIAELWDQTATEVSDASHDIRWAALQHKDPMPYNLHISLTNRSQKAMKTVPGSLQSDLDGNGWNVTEGDDFERGAMQCGGAQAVDEAIAPIKYALNRNPKAFPETSVSGVRLAKTKLLMNGPDIVFSHSVWFTIDEETREVIMLWVEITQPESMDWPDDEIPF